MFSSLDRVDIVLKAGPDGRPRYVQTDHRTPEEIAEEPDLSVLFALIRILNPRRMAEPGEPEPIMTATFQYPPPDFLWHAIHAASGLVTLGADLTHPMPGGPTPPLEEVIASAFAGLAQSVTAEHGVSLTVEGLATVEETLADEAGDPEEDEIDYWSAVVKLGAFGGEVIRASNGGQWTVTTSGTLPFSLTTRFRGGNAAVNPLGKAIKRFANGTEDTLVALVRTVCGQP